MAGNGATAHERRNREGKTTTGLKAVPAELSASSGEVGREQNCNDDLGWPEVKTMAMAALRRIRHLVA